MKKVNCAIIGCGRVSRFHAESYQALENSVLVAGIDIDETACQQFKEKYNVPTYPTLQQALDRHPIDLLSICTPHYLHYEQAKEAINKMINVLIEKPLCLEVHQADEIISLANEKGVVAGVCFQNIFNKDVLILQELVESGKLGKILLGNVCLRWFRDQSYYDDAWHGILAKSGGGALITQAIHHVDLLRRFMGQPARITGYETRLRRKAEVEDTLLADMVFGNGTLASVECTTITYPEHVEASITLIGEQGTIKIGGKSLNQIVYCNLPDFKIPDDQHEDNFFHLYGTSHIKLIGNVIDSIQNGSKVLATLNDGKQTLVLINNIYKSIQKV